MEGNTYIYIWREKEREKKRERERVRWGETKPTTISLDRTTL